MDIKKLVTTHRLVRQYMSNADVNLTAMLEMMTSHANDPLFAGTWQCIADNLELAARYARAEQERLDKITP